MKPGEADGVAPPHHGEAVGFFIKRPWGAPSGTCFMDEVWIR